MQITFNFSNGFPHTHTEKRNCEIGKSVYLKNENKDPTKKTNEIIKIQIDLIFFDSFKFRTRIKFNYLSAFNFAHESKFKNDREERKR